MRNYRRQLFTLAIALLLGLLFSYQVRAEARIGAATLGGLSAKPDAAGAPGPVLFARVSATLADSLAYTYHFTASGAQVYPDNRSEPYSWSLYEWDFGDGTGGGGQDVTHTYTGAGPYHITLRASDAQGHIEYAFKDIGPEPSLYADYFVGYRSRQVSGRSDLWWWYDTERSPWAARPADLYEPGSAQKKQSIAFYNPLVGYYDQWDPATIEYSILLSKMVGIDGFAFEYQDNAQGPAASLMPKFLPYAQQYDFKMTAHWIPSTMYDWYKDEVTSRGQMVDMGKDVIVNVTQNYILPSGATYRLGGVERPVWFLFSWDRNPSLPDNDLPYTQPSLFGYTRDEIGQLRSYAASQSGGVDPLILAAAWSFWPVKWDADSGEPFPLAGAVDGMYGWMKPEFEPIAAGDAYYNNHPYLGPDIDYTGTVAQNLAYFDKEYAETARLLNEGDFAVTGGTVFPGFDDAYNGAWGDGRRRYIPPQDAGGYTLAQTFDRFATNQTDLGLFATFADWAEGTTLEPTQELGFDVAMRAAKDIAAWKGLPVPSDEFLNSYLPYVVDIYNLRKQVDFLRQAGYSEAELQAFQQAIDAIIPPLLARDLGTAQTRREAAEAQYANLLGTLLPHDLTLEWVDEAQGASPTAGTLPMTMSTTGSSDAFTFPYPVRALLNSGTYTGTVSVEYQDSGTSFVAASINTLAAFGANSGETSEILKFQKTDSGAWRTARADFVNASFDARFNARPDLTFQNQGSLAYIDKFSHTANALTVGYWVNPDVITNGLQTQVLMINPDSGEEILVARINNAYLGGSTPGLLEVYASLGGEIKTVTVPNAFMPGNWMHVAIIWDGGSGQLQVYLNGAQGASLASTGALAATTQQVLIGAVTNGMDGLIDDLHIYDRALSGSEVGVLAGGGNIDTGLEGYWKFDESTGKTSADLSAHNRRANLYNGAGWTTANLPFTTGNVAALRLLGDSGGIALRRVKIDLNAYQKTAVPEFTPVFEEDFSDVSDWAATSVSVSTEGNVATVTVPGSPAWGKLERFDTGFVKVDFDQRPILRVTVTEATAMWKIVLFDAATWQSRTVKFLSTETGTLDFDLQNITEWGGGIKTLQIQLIVDGGSEGGGRYVKFDTLLLGQYTTLPAPTYGLVEDFAEVGEWGAWQASLSTDGQKATLTVAAEQSWGKMERLNPEQLITVDLDQHPILQTAVTAATGTWRLFVLDANDGWRSYELQPGTSQTGLMEYDIPALTGLSGTRTLQVQYVSEGAGTSLTVDDLRLGQPAHPADWDVGFREDFNDVSDWNLVDLNAATADGTATLSVAPGKLWGKAERLEFGRLIWVDLDRYPVLRLNVPSVNGVWKVVLYNATTWEEKLIKPMSDETGILDFDVKDITGWTGNEVPLQISIILDSVEGHYPGANLTLADLQFRRQGQPLQSGVFLQEDFSEVSDWEKEYLTLSPENGVSVAAVAAGNPEGAFGKMSRANPGSLYNVNLDDDPIMRINVTEAAALWKIVAYNVTKGWEEKTIKYLGNEAGELDFNIKDITGWSGKDVTLQVIIYVEGSPGQYVRFDTLQFRRMGHALPANVGFEEDFEDVSDWTLDGLQAETADGVTALSITQQWGKAERLNPGRLVWIDLDTYPVLKVNVTQATGRWKLCLISTADWNDVKVIQDFTTATGIRTYDVRSMTGWHGLTTMLLQVYMEGGTGQKAAFDFMQFATGFEAHVAMPYVQREQTNYSGAADLKMILDYEGAAAYTQTVLHTYGLGQNTPPNAGSNTIDPQGMYRTLNAYEANPDYNYAALSATNLSDAYHNISYWLAYQVPNADPARLPALIPLNGSYANWVVVNGVRTSANPLTASSYVVNGLWLTDPSTGGIGQNVYKTAAALADSYVPLSTSDGWNGQYVSVNEPPERQAEVAIAKPLAYEGGLSTKQDLTAAARLGLEQNILSFDAAFRAAYAGTQPGKPVLVQSAAGNYVIVPFVKSGGCAVAVILDATSGAFLEASYITQPDQLYVKRLARARHGKSVKVTLALGDDPSSFAPPPNRFQPSPGQMVLVGP